MFRTERQTGKNKLIGVCELCSIQLTRASLYWMQVRIFIAATPVPMFIVVDERVIRSFGYQERRFHLAMGSLAKGKNNKWANVDVLRSAPTKYTGDYGRPLKSPVTQHLVLVIYPGLPLSHWAPGFKVGLIKQKPCASITIFVQPVATGKHGWCG